jgi:clan AA aspartic protease (TIGR02281 family)
MLRLLSILALVLLAAPAWADAAGDLARLKPLADKGDVAAQYRVGVLYAESRNLIEAARYYQLAADKGHAEAQLRLASLNCNGMGVPKNPTECIRLYKLAADAGLTQAQVNLAARYLMGDGTAPNHGEAVRLARLAASKGDSGGELVLGLCYELGAGVLKDRNEAARLYKLSAAHGNASAQKALERLASNASAPAAAPKTGPQTTTTVSTFSVPLRPVAGILAVPAVMNGTVSANFVVDSGASHVVIPENLVQALRAGGKLSDADFISESSVKIADGTVVKSKVFVLRQLAVGNRVLENVPAMTAPSKAVPLLGQTFLQRFNSWAIDNDRKLLVLQEKETRR